MSQRTTTTAIRQYIVDYVQDHPSDIVRVTAERFGISRQAVNRHIHALEESGTLESDGKTRSRTYSLKVLSDTTLTLPIAGLEEHVPWQNSIRPKLEGVPKNVVDICYYGFTEMLNNAIDHSGSEYVRIDCQMMADFVDLKVSDSGIGIFRKIKEAFNLPDELEAIKQLAKGKLTTDPARHTGEGIFFTSRMFDRFIIMSGDVYFSHLVPDNNWLIEDADDPIPGTYVRMTISTRSGRDIKQVFDSFTVEEEDFGFSKTRIPVSLLQYGADNLVSRSQAKRVLSRFEMFKEVILDFDGVPLIGQAFADEIFRVFQTGHPEVSVRSIHANPFVNSMIQRAVLKRESEATDKLRTRLDDSPHDTSENT